MVEKVLGCLQRCSIFALTVLEIYEEKYVITGRGKPEILFKITNAQLESFFDY
jgi:hypothetical protein